MLVVVLGAKTEGNPHIPWTQRSKEKVSKMSCFAYLPTHMVPKFVHAIKLNTSHMYAYRIYIMLMLMLILLLYYAMFLLFLVDDDDDVDALLFFGWISPLLGVYFLEVVVVSLHRAIRTTNRPFLHHCSEECHY